MATGLDREKVFRRLSMSKHHLDRLAREGFRFTNAHVTTSICGVSRASLFTGQWMSRHGIIKESLVMKSFLRIIAGVALIASGLTGSGAVMSAGGVASPPNIVVIISDDHGWTDYGFMGHPHIRTPRLDKLASQSLTFTRGYVPTALCSPSLTSIITGRYPQEHLITYNDPPAPPGGKQGDWRNRPEYVAAWDEMRSFITRVPTLPRLLRQKGYLSLQTGKWWLGNYANGGFTDGMSHGDRRRGGRH